MICCLFCKHFLRKKWSRRGGSRRGGKNNYTSRILEFKPMCKQFINNCRSHRTGVALRAKLVTSKFPLPIDIIKASELTPSELRRRFLVENVVASLLVFSNLLLPNRIDSLAARPTSLRSAQRPLGVA